MKKRALHVVPIFLFLTLLGVVTACATNSNDAALRSANQRLHELELRCQKQKKQIENSLMIPYDSLGNYMMTITFGQDVIQPNETVEFTTVLAWKKLPANIQTAFVYDRDAATLRNEKYTDLKRYLNQSYNKQGDKLTTGAYRLTFPTGKQTLLGWSRYVTVK
jgi:hypothetical protein